MAPVSAWDEHGNPIQQPTAWDEHGNPVTAPPAQAAAPANDHVFSGDTSGFKPDDNTGGFFQHVWNNINPSNIVSSIGTLLQRPVKTYLNDEQQRADQLGRAKKQLVNAATSPNMSIGTRLVNGADAIAAGAGSFVPFVGTAANNAADEASQGHVAAGLGDATGLGLMLATPDIIKGMPDVVGGLKEVPGAVAESSVGRAASKVKNAVTVSPELKATAAKTVSDVQAEALPDLTSRVGKVIDDTAKGVQDANGQPVDTSQIPGLSDKAAYAGDAYKQAGQRVYKQLDDLAKQTTGKDWAFQKLATDVHKLQEIIDDPETPLADRGGYETQLADAKTRLDNFTKAAEQAGIPNIKAAIAQGNKLYSTGLSLEETARGIARNEKIVVGPDGSISRVLKGNNFPLDAAVRQVTDTARPRGHVLAQAVGKDAAGEVQRAVADASRRVQEGKQAASVARKQVKTIRKRQAVVGAGAASILGAKLYGAAKGGHDALRGK